MFVRLFEKLRKVTEAVATEVSPQEKMRKLYKSVLNSELKPSTHYREKGYKFWLLANGDIVPVEFAHGSTAGRADITSSELYFNGAASGSYEDQTRSLLVDTIRLTSQQISKLKQLYIKYKPTSLYADIEKLGSFSTDIKSVKDLDYFLNYGPIDEAKSDLPDIWLDHPDMFEAGEGLKYDVKIIPLNKITDVTFAVTIPRKKIEKIFQSGESKLPLILVEDKGDGTYELFDGEHRYAAYVNVFPDVSCIKVAAFRKKK